MKLQIAALSFFAILSTQAFALQCGETISSRVVMKEDLDCSSFSGYAALRLDQSAVLIGNGHKIISPNTTVGVYAEGNIVRIRDLKIIGGVNAIGVQGYNVERLVLDRVVASDMYIGVDYYTEVGFDCDRLRVVDSDLSRNSYGAKVVSPNCEYSPRFLRTDFSDSKEFALNLSAQKIRVREIHSNIFDRSTRGLLLKGKELIFLEGLDLASTQIDGTQVYAYGSEKFVARNMIVGSNSSEGLHLYDIADVNISNLQATNADVGIKVANDQVATDLKIVRTTTSGSSSIGLLVTSYGQTKFSNININRNNDFDYAVINNQ